MKKNIYILLGLVLTGLKAYGQQPDDNIIFKAMEDEMERNKKELRLPNNPDPFYISYTVKYTYNDFISGSLGVVSPSSPNKERLDGSARVYVGDYKLNSDPSPFYMGYYGLVFPKDNDYDAMRRALWLMTDLSYKRTLQEWTNRKNALVNNPLPQREADLDDWQKIEPVTYIEDTRKDFSINRSKWEKLVGELSAIFKQYPDLRNSNVNLNTNNQIIYKLTTEGVKMKQSLSYYYINISANVFTNDGETISDSYFFLACNEDEIPEMNVLVQKTKELAESLVKRRTAPVVDDYYIGPILFEDLAVNQLFLPELFSPNGLLATSKYNRSKKLANRLGKKIIDDNITIKNRTDWKKYKGQNLIGYYPIDMDGIVPPAEITLIENGILKSLLNDRHPILQAPKSTGSSRIPVYSPNGGGVISLGIVQILAEKRESHSKLKKELLKIARKRNLEYAYIIRGNNFNSSIYQVDVKSGKETPVRSTDIAPTTLIDLRNICGVSKEENVYNLFGYSAAPYSLIGPKSILLDDVEINISNRVKQKQPILGYPLKRESVSK